MEDPATGHSFRFPGGMKIAIYVEVSIVFYTIDLFCLEYVLYWCIYITGLYSGFCLMGGISVYFEMKGGEAEMIGGGGAKPLISCTECHLSKFKGGETSARGTMPPPPAPLNTALYSIVLCCISHTTVKTLLQSYSHKENLTIRKT